MIVNRIACLSVLLFAGCLSGAEITGETKVQPYKLVRLAVKDAPPKAGLLWRVRGSGAIDYAGPRNQPTLAFVAPPGVYQVEATIGTVGTDGSLLLDAVEVSVTIEGQAPAPIPPTPTPPNPNPPTPTPAPKHEFLWLVVVEETANRTPEQGRLIGDAAYWQGIKSKGHDYRVIDKDDPSPQAKKFAADVGNISLPALIAYPQEIGARPIVVVPLPKDKAGVDEFIKITSGK